MKYLAPNFILKEAKNCFLYNFISGILFFILLNLLFYSLIEFSSFPINSNFGKINYIIAIAFLFRIILFSFQIRKLIL